MPPIETIGLLQKIVLFRANGTDRNGFDTVSAGEELSARLVTGLNDSFEQDGKTISVNGTLVLNQAVPIGSIVWEGALADLPAEPTDLLVVVALNKTPDIKNRNTRYDASLSKFSDQLPTVV